MANKIFQTQIHGTKDFFNLDEEMKKIHSTTDQNERDIDKLQGDSTKAAGDISSLGARVGKAETDIVDAKGKIEENKNSAISLDERTKALESLMVDGVTKKSIVFYVGMIKFPEGHRVSTYVPLKGKLNKFYMVLGNRPSAENLQGLLKNESGDTLCEINISAGNVYTDGTLENVPVSYEPLHLVLYGEVSLRNISIVFDIIPDAIEVGGEEQVQG